MAYPIATFRSALVRVQHCNPYHCPSNILWLYLIANKHKLKSACKNAKIYRLKRKTQKNCMARSPFSPFFFFPFFFFPIFFPFLFFLWHPFSPPLGSLMRSGAHYQTLKDFHSSIVEKTIQFHGCRRFLYKVSFTISWLSSKPQVQVFQACNMPNRDSASCAPLRSLRLRQRLPAPYDCKPSVSSR